MQTEETQQTENTQKSTQPDTKEEASLEELNIMLKEKLKENKNLQNKTSKLETKYIEIFRQHKSIKNDHTTFIGIFKMIFPNFQEKDYGSYRLETIEDMWRKREEHFGQKLRQLMDETNRQKNDLQQSFKAEIQQRLETAGSESKMQYNALQSQNDSLKKSNKQLVHQLNDLDKNIEEQSSEISRLAKQKLKLEYEMNQLRMKQFTEQLMTTTEEDDLRKKESESRNQFLGLRQQVQNLLSVRDQSRKEIKELKAQVMIKDKLLAEKSQEIGKLTQQLNRSRIPPESPIQKVKNHEQEMKEAKREESPNQEANGKHRKKRKASDKTEKVESASSGEDFIHREYLKNTFIRYFKSCHDGDQTRSQILLNVIVTILKFDNTEICTLHGKKKAWWNLY